MGVPSGFAQLVPASSQLTDHLLRTRNALGGGGGGVLLHTKRVLR